MKAATTAVSGKIESQKSRRGEQLTLEEAAKAHCYQCMGGYPEGTGDCLNVECHLHPFMPYRDARVEEVIIEEAIISGGAKIVSELVWVK